MVPPEEREGELMAFYEAVEREDLEYFALSEEKMPSFFIMLEKIRPASRLFPTSPNPPWSALRRPGGPVRGRM